MPQGTETSLYFYRPSPKGLPDKNQNMDFFDESLDNFQKIPIFTKYILPYKKRKVNTDFCFSQILPMWQNEARQWGLTDKNLQISVDFYHWIVYDRIAKYGMPVGFTPRLYYAAGITL